MASSIYDARCLWLCLPGSDPECHLDVCLDESQISVRVGLDGVAYLEYSNGHCESQLLVDLLPKAVAVIDVSRNSCSVCF